MIINIISLTFFRNLNPLVNNNGLIKSIILNNGVYPMKEGNKIHI